jgi:hypothetical protein
MGKYQFLDDDYGESYHNNGLTNQHNNKCRWDNGHSYKSSYPPKPVYPSQPTYGYGYQTQHLSSTYADNSYNYGCYSSQYDRRGTQYYPEYTDYGVNSFQQQQLRLRKTREEEKRLLEEKIANEKKQLDNKIDSIQHDISFNSTPSNEFLEMLLSENNEVKEYTPLFIAYYDKSDDNKIEIEMTKSSDRKITYDIDININPEHLPFQDKCYDLLTEMKNELAEFVECENKYKYVEKENNSELKDKLFGINSNSLDTNESMDIVDPVIKTSELPLGYSSIDINEDEYEIVEKNVHFDDNVTKYEYEPEYDNDNSSDDNSDDDDSIIPNVFPFNVIFGY